MGETHGPHGIVSTSRDRFICQRRLLLDNYFLEGREYQFYIIPETGLFDIFEVDFEFVRHHLFDIAPVGVFRRCQYVVLVAIPYRGKRGYPRTYRQYAPLFGRIHVDIFPYFRTGADEAHITLEYVDELRKLIKLVLAYIIPAPGYTRIVASDSNQSQFVTVRTHRAELEKSEILIVPAYTHLPIEDRSPTVTFYPYRQNGKKRAEAKKPQSARYNVERSFHKIKIKKEKIRNELFEEIVIFAIKKAMSNNPLLDKSTNFAIRIIRLYQHVSKYHSEYVITKQILRSGTSIGANIREGLMGISKADFIAKLHISLKETSETEYWLELLYKTDYITFDEYLSVSKDCSEVKALLISTLKTSKKNMS